MWGQQYTRPIQDAYLGWGEGGSHPRYKVSGGVIRRCQLISSAALVSTSVPVFLNTGKEINSDCFCDAGQKHFNTCCASCNLPSYKCSKQFATTFKSRVIHFLGLFFCSVEECPSEKKDTDLTWLAHNTRSVIIREYFFFFN